MIDFTNASVFKLKAGDSEELGRSVQPLLVPGEKVVAAFKAIRDYVIFTNKRLLTVNVQGMMGKKQDFTSLPYSKVQAWSVATAGNLDLDAELELWFSGMGRVRLEFKGSSDIRSLGQMIASYVL
ncbi:MAG TPA: PH domain-containing protein [Acidimicrobiales bacterium]|nr:PH domain-containing protein [Acidimicrobiales bacterium]